MIRRLKWNSTSRSGQGSNPLPQATEGLLPPWLLYVLHPTFIIDEYRLLCYNYSVKRGNERRSNPEDLLQAYRDRRYSP